jgi:hypothetical protein
MGAYEAAARTRQRLMIDMVTTILPLASISPGS